MTGLSDGGEPKLQQRQLPPRHGRSQSMQEPGLGVSAGPNAKLWATNQLFSPADSASASRPAAHVATDDSPVFRGNVRRMGSGSFKFAGGDDVVHDVCSNSGRCRPLGMFSGIFADLLACVVPRSSSESTQWTRSRAKALLDLSKRQQSALIDKQDAIDLLEWKLRKLSAMDAKSHAAAESAAAASDPEDSNNSSARGAVILDDTCSESSGSSSTSSSSSWCGSSGGALSARATAEPTLADLCRNAKNSFSEDSWKLEEKRDSVSMPGFKDMTMSDKVPLFEMACTRARVAVRYFCKVFMQQMEFSGYSVSRTLAAIDPSAKFMKREHTWFVLEANINKAMYHWFETDSFDDTGLTLIIDPKQRASARFEEFQRLRLVDSVDAANTGHADFEPKFLAFCEQKMREIWFLFPWNIVFRDTDARKHFTGAFLDAAKCIWLLHRLASSIFPAASILRVGKGMHIDAQYVEAVTSDAASTCDAARVQFMIAPGFQVLQNVIKCQVYEHLADPRHPP